MVGAALSDTKDAILLDKTKEIKSPRGGLHKSTFVGIPEAKGLTWHDSFYNGGQVGGIDIDETIVAVFDRDHTRATRYAVWDVTLFQIWLYVFFSIIVTATSGDLYILLDLGLLFLLITLLCAPWFYFICIRLEQKGQVHVAITTSGIRFDYRCPEYENCWRNSSSVRYEKVLIPFSKFDTCVVEDKGSLCFRNFQRLSEVRLTNCSVGTSRVYYDDLDPAVCPLVGLVQPQEFADLVMAMKSLPTIEKGQCYHNHHGELLVGSQPATAGDHTFIL